MTTTDAIETVLDLDVGQSFAVRGRTFTKRTHSCDGYGDASTGGERMVVGVWNDRGRVTTVTIRPTDEVTVIS